MRSALLFISVLLLSLSGWAQRFKYKELFPMIQSAKTEEQKLMLVKEYLIADSEHPNANYLLAKSYTERYKSADVLTDYERAIANAEQAKNRLLKCQYVIDEREVRRNNEYYLRDDGSELSFDDLKNFLQVQYDSTVVFLEKVPPIYEAFTKAVRNYDQAVKYYAEIAGSYNSLDDLLMLYDAELEAKLNVLMHSFDSTVIYLNQYKELKAGYNVGHDQSFELRSLSTFRLQGMVARIPFLDDQFYLWDYTSWANETMATASNDLPDIRQRLLEKNKELDDALAASVSTVPEEEVKGKVSKELIYHLEKYDFQSLPVSVLEYKDFLYLWKVNELEETYYDTASNLEIETRYFFYSQMINRSREADTLLSELQRRITNPKVDKHKEYIQSSFGGMDGLKKYSDDEATRLNNKKRRYEDKLRDIIRSQYQGQSSTEGTFVTHQRKKIPAYVTGVPAIPEAESYYTSVKKMSPDGSFYMAGFKTNKAVTTTTGFIYKYDKGKVVWLKEYSISLDSAEAPSRNQVPTMEVTKEGVVVAVHVSNEDYSSVKNWVVYLNDQGAEILRKPITKTDLFPTDIDFREADNRFVFVYSGKSSEEKSDVFLTSLNEFGDELWSTSIDMEGSPVDIVPLSSGYILVANIARYSGIKANTQSAGRAVVIRLNNQGKVLHDEIVDVGEMFTVDYVVKASDSCINLMGSDGDSAGDGQDYHIIIDYTGKVISSDLK